VLAIVGKISTTQTVAINVGEDKNMSEFVYRIRRKSDGRHWTGGHYGGWGGGGGKLYRKAGAARNVMKVIARMSWHSSLTIDMMEIITYEVIEVKE